MLSTSILLCCVLLTICGSTSGQGVCDPRSFSPADFPSLLTDLEVVGSHPLKLRAHSRLVNSTDEITFEGMVLGNGWTANNGIFGTEFTTREALGACRSLGCGEVGANDFTTWNQTETCEFKCPDGKKANRQCSFMVDSLECKDDAMNLAECMKKSFFRYESREPEWAQFVRFVGINLVCRECGEQ